MMAAPVAAAANINVASIVDTEIFMIVAATVCLDGGNGEGFARISMRWSQELLMSDELLVWIVRSTFLG